MPSKLVWLLVSAFAAGAAQRAQPNSRCEWPPQAFDPIDVSRPADRQRLARDAEFAEDLAIRYADACCGPHSGRFVDMESYGRQRDRCMNALFERSAHDHGVTAADVRRALAYRPRTFDLAVLFSFAALYAAGAYLVAAAVERRFGGVMTAYAGGIAAMVGVLLLDVWSGAMEDLRIGNGHLSYRGERIPWLHHRPALFLGTLLLYGAVAAARFRRRGESL